MRQGYVLLSCTGEIHVCDLEWVVVKGFARLSEFVVFNWGSTKLAVSLTFPFMEVSMLGVIRGLLFYSVMLTCAYALKGILLSCF